MMQGGKRLICALGFLLAILESGCAEVVPKESSHGPSQAAVGAEYDEAQTGAIEGLVTWEGDVPRAAPLRVLSVLTCREEEQPDRPNPRLPRIDAISGGVAGAVVYLRSVAPRKSRPWQHAKVRVLQRDREIVIQQGDVESRVGWVLQDDSVEIVSLDPELHIVHGKGAAYFSLPFHDRNRPTAYRLGGKGVVTLSSGAGYFWMDGHLFVDRHPYYCQTDSTGRFRLDKVPAGRYELVCWLPNWQLVRQLRDPEYGLVTRVEYEPPVEQTSAVEVTAGEGTGVLFEWSAGDFRR